MNYRPRPRLSIEITEEQSAKLYNLIPWGLKKELFSALIDGVIELFETPGVTTGDVLGALIDRRLKVKDMDIFKTKE